MTPTFMHGSDLSGHETARTVADLRGDRTIYPDTAAARPTKIEQVFWRAATGVERADAPII
jgi:hypothetical protein